MFNGVTQSIRLIGLSFQSLVLTRMKHVIINHNKGIYRLTIDYIYIYILYYPILSVTHNSAALQSRFGNPENSSNGASLGPEKSSAPWKFILSFFFNLPKKILCFFITNC